MLRAKICHVVPLRLICDGSNRTSTDRPRWGDCPTSASSPSRAETRAVVSLNPADSRRRSLRAPPMTDSCGM